MKNNDSMAYYLGLDVGTDSVGYAVTDRNYALLKHKGDAVWGTHVFDPAALGDTRRAFRTARRRLDRRQRRVLLVQELFAKEIAEADEGFFRRIQESALWAEDAQEPKGLFTDPTFDDKDYYRRYPTIHHLIMDLINDPKPHDVRLVYLACGWLVAHRGHFLSQVARDNIADIVNFEETYKSFWTYFEELEMKPWNDGVAPEAICEALEKSHGVTGKKKALQELLGCGRKDEEDEFPYSRQGIIALLSGGSCKLADLYRNEALLDMGSIRVDMAEEQWEQIISDLGDDAELLIRIKAVTDCVALKKLMGGERYISTRKVSAYDQHKRDLKCLKTFIKKHCPERYKEVFVAPGKSNYVAYSKNYRGVPGTVKSRKGTTQENFCKYIKGIVGKIVVPEAEQEAYREMMQRLEENTFMPRQVTGENRLIPYQLYWTELSAILENAKEYLPFLKEKDADGLTVCDKLLSVFEFRIPYFVGPLNRGSNHAWLTRKAEGPILPWNFERMVDMDASETAFIRKMTNKCTYLPEEDVLPKASLLYQRFEVLNELNNVKMDGNDISPEVKQLLYTELFLKTKTKVTKKKIRDALVSFGLAGKEAQITGVDDPLKSSLGSYHAFRRLLESKTLTESDVEKIILQSTVTEDRSRLRKWLGKTYPALSEKDVAYVAAIKCKDFGRLSGRFLDGDVLHVDQSTGETRSILEMMWSTNSNLMQLLSDRFDFAERVREAQQAFYGGQELKLADRFDLMRVSNAVRRPIYRALDIVRDVVKAQGGKMPEKIFVEMARGGEVGGKGKRTKSRYEQLMELYRAMNGEAAELQHQLEEMGEEVNNRLQSDKLFLYYLQLGKSAYSGAHISLADLADDSKTNIDHIYPQARVSDDSILNNKVLCLSEENGTKSDTYPVPREWRSKMHGFWVYLKENGLMTEEKFKRLTRSTPFTEEEKWGFINRQLVETRQSTKVIATLLGEKYPDSKIVYVKAGLVSDFRHEYGFVKSRAVNDLHHAKDAYLNIVVGDAYSAKFTREWFMRHTEDYSLRLTATFGKMNRETGIWTGTRFFDDRAVQRVRATMAKNNIHYTAYPVCKRGGFFDQMPVAAAEGLIPLKKGMDTAKYGGYNKPAASFYTLAKFTDGKNPELMLVPVELLHADAFEALPTALEYTGAMVEEITGKKPADLSLPFGLRKIKIKTVFELDGFRCCLNGKSSGGKDVIMSPMNALVLSAEEEKYIKRLERFCEKRKENPKLLYTPRYDGIDVERNAALYQTLVGKLERFYYKRPGVQVDKVKDGYEKFEQLSAEQQAANLLSLIALFGRIGQKAADIDIGSGACMMNAKLSNWAKRYKTAYIIDTPASGLYEKRSENLLEMVE